MAAEAINADGRGLGEPGSGGVETKLDADPVESVESDCAAAVAIEIDCLLERYLNLLDEQQLLQEGIGRLFAAGFFSLARANHVSAGKRYGSDYYDERMKAIRTLEIRESELDADLDPDLDPDLDNDIDNDIDTNTDTYGRSSENTTNTTRATCPGSGSRTDCSTGDRKKTTKKKKKKNQRKQEGEPEEGQESPVRSFCFTVHNPYKAMAVGRKERGQEEGQDGERTADEKAEHDHHNKNDHNENSKANDNDNDHKPQAPPNPLRAFGILVPQPLRHAQHCFATAIAGAGEAPAAAAAEKEKGGEKEREKETQDKKNGDENENKGENQTQNERRKEKKEEKKENANTSSGLLPRLAGVVSAMRAIERRVEILRAERQEG